MDITVELIEKEEAGVRMDEWVAEYVMGWKLALSNCDR